MIQLQVSNSVEMSGSRLLETIKLRNEKRISYNLINILVPVLLTVSNSVEMSSSRLLETIKLRNEKE